MAIVAQYDNTLLIKKIDSLKTSPNAFMLLVEYLSDSNVKVEYDGNKKALISIIPGDNISKTPDVTVSVNRVAGTGNHELIVNGEIVADILAKVPPRQG